MDRRFFEALSPEARVELLCRLHALAIEPDPAVEGKRDLLRAKADLARLPEEYRAIGSAPQLSRGALAALIGVRLAPLLEGRFRLIFRIYDTPLTTGSQLADQVMPNVARGSCE